MRGGAHGINAGQDRTDRAIDNRIRRDVGGGVDDVTHWDPPQALCAHEAERNETIIGRGKPAEPVDCRRNRRNAAQTAFSLQLTVIGCSAGSSPVRELKYYLDQGGQATDLRPVGRFFDRSRQQESRIGRKVRAKEEKFSGGRQSGLDSTSQCHGRRVARPTLGR